MAERSKVFLRIAGVLFVLLGLAWSVGGVALFSRGSADSPRIVAAASTTRIVAASLLVVGAFLIGSGLAVLLRSRFAWLVGISAAVAFVLDSFVSNYLLYGSLQLPQTLAHTALAALVIYFVSKGREAL
jgi:hypothetical protein